MTIGAGRVVLQDLPRIDAAVADGSLARNPALLSLIERLRESGGRCHLMGLVSPGGVHSHQDHMMALARIVSGAGVPVAVHAFLDGRDVPPRSAIEDLPRFEAALSAISPTCGSRPFAAATTPWTATSAGSERRGPTMPWCPGRAARRRTQSAAVAESYARDVGDEFVEPAVIAGYAGMADGDGLVMANFRADRARQIMAALLDPAFDELCARAARALRRCRRHVQLFGKPGPAGRDDVPAAAGGGRPRRGRLARRAAPAPHRRDREVRPRHVLPQRRRGARDAGRGTGARALAQGRDLRPEARDVGRGGHRRRGGGHRGRALRPDRRELRQPGHGGPHRQPERGDGGGRRRGPLPRPARGCGGGRRRRAPHHRRPRQRREDAGRRDAAYRAHARRRACRARRRAGPRAPRRRARRYRADGARPDGPAPAGGDDGALAGAHRAGRGCGALGDRGCVARATRPRQSRAR